MNDRLDARALNPLLHDCGLPLFDAVTPALVEPAIDQLLQQASAALEQVCASDSPTTWEHIARTLDVPTERLSRAWSVVSHLSSVADTPALRAAYNAALPRVTEFWTRLGADERLYAKYKAIDAAGLTPEQRQAHKNALRSFVLGGAELQGAAKARHAWLQERSAELSQKFSENTLDATDAFALYLPTQELAGVPADVLQASAAAAQADGQSGHKLTLKMPCYLPVMQFAHNRALRERLYRAYVTRASDQAEGDAVRFDNTAVMTELLALRQEEAQLLGCRHYADLSLVPKMAESPEQVLTFLRELAAKARHHAEQDLADLRDFARRELGLNEPQTWDWPYIGERLKEARFAFSEQEVKLYFTAPQVLAGLFQIIETLFEVSIRPDAAPLWHPSARFYRIERQSLQGLELLGQFYLDPGARAGKRGGAWMDDARARWLRPDSGKLQTPLAHLVCNFAEGAGGQPPLLTHDDVITLFHEFGHGLHHLLTQVDERDVAGISGVEWDAVELPSQLMENFCWEWDVLKRMTAHVETGAALPRELFDKMRAAKNFQSGLQTLRQVELSLFDMLLHCQPQPADCGAAIVALQEQVRDEVALLRPPAYSRTPNTFNHIFAGGYAAGYYSYKWAEVLSADAYAVFEEAAQRSGQGALDRVSGRRFRQQILEVGGSRPAMESFHAFRGREPSIDALLRHQGMD
ncbi:M3 family metallopeptidase [Hydrogenophaga sp.]|uniref:M3 family metallopeptidase n=1 Tax=Hydrogenophaga sp. TaxID=1904254 RepID=UPI00199A7A14|nr:M3 family metallopeptidase [Hydrogenophaga sp.]MBD3892931.1 M3 family peptidase [Hydrogenophaga sp.]